MCAGRHAEVLKNRIVLTGQKRAAADIISRNATADHKKDGRGFFWVAALVARKNIVLLRLDECRVAGGKLQRIAVVYDVLELFDGWQLGATAIKEAKIAIFIKIVPHKSRR